MAIDKIVPKYLNKEDDVRLVKNVEMTDALNVRISADMNGDGGVIKNAYGNSEVSFRYGDSLPAGTNEVIGNIADTQSGEIFFFVWNINDDHSIYRYSASSDEAQLIYRDSVLAFSKYYHIRGAVVKNLLGETLLYFSDANNSPKKINVTRALLGLYPAAFTSGTDAQKLLCLTIAKQPPQNPPTFVFSTNPSKKQNTLYETTYQFAAQYVYQDGERSAISPYSEVAVSQIQFLDGILTEEQKNIDNTLTVSADTSESDVKEIIFLARNGNTGVFYEIATAINDATSSTVSISFDNSKLYTAVGTAETDKLYDNVPQSAEALTITGNRLMLGGYTEGYGNIRPDVDVLANYYPSIGEYDIDVVYPAQNTLGLDVNSWFKLDISGLPAVTTEDSVLNISFSLNLGRVNISMYGAYIQWVQTKKATQEDHDFGGLVSNLTGVNLKASPFSVSKTINVNAGTSKSDIVDLIKQNINGFYSVIYDSDITDFDYATQITNVEDLQGVTNPNKWMFFAGSGQISVSEASVSSTELIFRMNFLNATLTAKAGYNYNVSGLLNSGANLFGLRQLFTRGRAIGQKYPATNRLFNEIDFVDAPSLIFNGNGNTYVKYTDILTTNNVLTPAGSSSTQVAYLNPLFNGQDDKDIAVSFEATFLTNGNITSYQTFKAGATHSFGLVYYDEYNRGSGVQTLQDLHINWFSERASQNNLAGRAASILRLKHTAPSWATKWAPVYAKVNSVINKFQYSITSAFIGSNLQAVDFSGITTLQDTVFLSLRSLEGKDDSYNSVYSANLEYSFEKGDRLRIVRYAGGISSSIDVEVLNYYTFTEDINTNPILDLTSDEETFNTTGNFIAIRSVTDSGWSNFDVVNNQDNWSNECVIEIYRINKTATEQIYYEIGRAYDVANGVHSGDRTSISTFNVNVVDATDRNNLEVQSNIIAYRGDILTDGLGNTLVVGNVYPEVNGAYNYVFYAATQSGTFSATTYNLNITNSSDAVVMLEEGDSYYRPRMLKFGKKAYSNNFKFSFIEDYSVSDRFTSNSVSTGRPHAVIPDAKTIFRKGSVTYSDAFIIDGQYLGLSSFNPSLANFYDFDYRYGAVKQIIGDDDRMYIIQERKAGWVTVGRNIIESTDGAQSLTLSRDVFGVVNYYLGDYGINNNPESLATDRGRIYFADIRAGKVVRISRDGITLISEANMDAFFKDNFSNIVTSTSFNKVIGGVDVDNDEYIISSAPIFISTVTISDAVPAVVATYELQTSGASVVTDIALATGDDSNLFTFDTEIREFQEICDEFDDSLNAIVFLDKLNDGQPAYVGEEFIGSSASIYGVATNSTYDFFVDILLNLGTGTFTFSNACGDYTGAISAATDTGYDFTAGYAVTDNVWNTLYSYRPEGAVSIDDTLFTFDAGKIYKHHSGADRSTYYGPAYDTVVEVISAFNPSMVKTYESLSLEGNAAWAAEVTNTDQSASILSTDFSERERNWYAYIPRDSSANTGTSTITALSGSSEIFALGSVSSVAGSNIVFTSDISYITFPIGASLYKVSGSTLVSITNTIAGVSNGTTINCASSVAGVSPADEIVAIANGAIEGDQIRDYYAKIRLTSDATNEIELYAVNAVFSKSNLANQLGQ